jgi:hypothetical protein
MANTFKNYVGAATTGGATIYTVPGATVAVIIGANLANISASQVTASVQLGATYIIKDVPLPAGSALSVLDGKIIGEASDTIVVTASSNSAVDVVLSVLEQS